MDFGAIYAETRQRIAELTSGLSDEQLDTEAPATPGWRVRDIVSHLTGGAADFITGNMEGAGGEAWTAAQVEARRATPHHDVIAEWEKVAAQIEPAFEGGPPQMGFLIADIGEHEHDIRGAIRQAGHRDSAAVQAGTQVMTGGVDRMLKGANLGLRIRSGNQEWELGAGEPGATVTADPFELYRALAGRRSPQQVAQWKWDGDPSQYFGLMSVFPLRATDLVE
ncbi:MAG: maleylpyruvate isomerase family mycothiol-dependent enzyme [Actinobacteria bacterium]|nr:maleylpyruvate isomerase family mycothiol-dependent enzyme [Actinomycetota bacterium]